MADLKLPKLPDRTPVKLVVALPPELFKGLEDYRTIYNERYSAKEPLSELVAPMLDAFLSADKEFAKERKRLSGEQR